MCKRRKPDVRTVTREEAYEGATIRFDPPQGEANIYRRHHRCSSFPWWTLWLIWPLIGILKWLVPTLVGTAATISAITLPLLPIVMIVIGVLLLRRK